MGSFENAHFGPVLSNCKPMAIEEDVSEIGVNSFISKHLFLNWAIRS